MHIICRLAAAQAAVGERPELGQHPSAWRIIKTMISALDPRDGWARHWTTRLPASRAAMAILLVVTLNFSWTREAVGSGDVATAVLSTAAHGQQARCTFAAEIDSGSTEMHVSGTVSYADLEAQIDIGNSNEVPTLAGTVQVELRFVSDGPTDEELNCQSLIGDLSRNVSLLSISRATEAADSDSAIGLQLLPSPIELRVSLGMIPNAAMANIYNVSLFLDTEEGLSPGQDGSFRDILTTTVTNGNASITNSMLSLNTSISIGDTMPAGDTPVVVELTREQLPEGVRVSLRLTDMNTTQPLTINDQLSATITLSGELLAVALIAPPPLTPGATSSATGDCVSPLVSNGTSGCSCPVGTMGTDCQVCTTDQGCGSDQYCSSSFAFASAPGAKSYACKPQDSTFLAVVPSIAFGCSPPGAAEPPSSVSDLPIMDPQLGFCEVQVEVNLGEPAVIECTAFNCQAETGNSSTSCNDMVCECPDGCPGLEFILASLSGAEIDCDPSGFCAVDIQGLPLPNLTADCVAGQCISSEQSLADSSTTGSSPSPTPSTSPIPGLNTTAKMLPVSEPQVELGAPVSPQPEQSPPQATTGCSEGLTGASCEVCYADSGCAADGAVCDASFLFWAQTTTKAFTCTTDDPTVSEFISFLEMQCSTSGPLPEALQSVPNVDASSSFCSVQVGIAIGVEPVQASCWAYNCAIQANTSKTDCTGLTCQCPGSCFGLNELIDQLSSVVFSCLEAGKCDVSLGGLPISNIALSCQAGECIDDSSGQNNFTGTVGTVTASTVDWDRVIIAAIAFLPSAFLLVLLAVIVLLARGCTWICFASTGKKIAPERQRPIGSLVFHGLSVTVPQRKGSADTMAQQGQPVADSLDNYTGDSESQPATLTAPSYSDAPAVTVGWTKGADQHGPTRPGKRLILSDVSCSVRQGEVLAIMGPSGSGKTTLLSILAAREGDLGRNAKVKGDVLVDGARRKQSQFRTACAYVPQDDTLFPSLTVRETVDYSARLRMPELDNDQRAALVTETLEELRIAHVADTRLGSSTGAGGAGRGVSGGERRRVSIAMEMVTQPSIIMLDEPTSGLDSFAAGSLMSSLKDIAAPGRVVVLTLHQPSPAAFMQLDKVLLLAAGQRIFHGTPTEVETFFQSSGYPCGHGIPIADHMLSVVSNSPALKRLVQLGQTPPAESSATTTGGQKAHKEPVTACNLFEEQSMANSDSSQSAPSDCLARVNSALVQLDVLLWRGGTIMARNPALLLMHSVIAILMGVGMGVVFFGVVDDLAGLQNRAGGIFFTLAFFAFCSLTTVDSFLSERSIVLREVQSGYYSAFRYLVIKVVLDTLLLRVLPAVLFSFPFYYLMGLGIEWERVLVWFAILTVFSSTAGALSMAASIGCPTAGTANLVMTLVLLVSLVFGGFLANLEVMPTWISWISYLSIFRYAFEALVINEMTGTSFNMDIGVYAVNGLDSQLLLDVLGLNEEYFRLDVIILDVLFSGILLVSAVVLFAKLPRHGRRRSCWTVRSGCCRRCL